MREHPILFSGEMVRAILEGRKTQTRRVITRPEQSEIEFDGKDFWAENEYGEAINLFKYCPYGQPGDRLWVRETFVIESASGGDSYDNVPDNRPFKQDEEEGLLIPHYRSTEPDAEFVEPNINLSDWNGKTKWKPSIFMPRWASRITLEIVSVRVERLQDINDEDAVAEGVTVIGRRELNELSRGKFIHSYKCLWNEINGKRPGCTWDDNPWVWRIEFKKP